MLSDELIPLYLFICCYYQTVLQYHCQRFSNNQKQFITDEEIITIYFHGLRQGFRDSKKIYLYTAKHLQDWFPNLKTYENFNYRLNKLSAVFPVLLECLVSEKETETAHIKEGLVDSMPIILAQRGRRYNAKVATEIASNNGYCPTKKLHYHGMKLHIVAARAPGTLPTPSFIVLTDAGTNDNHALERMDIEDKDIYADKAYLNSLMHAENRVKIIHPIKKDTGQEFLDASDQLYSTAVASIRQPIESLFSWINEKTGIQIASKVRSTAGLITHIFGRLCVAFMERWAIG